MKKILLLFLFFLTSCSANLPKSDLNFSKDMNFDEFKDKLEEYAKINSYPNIDY
tara:strand:- start:4102 stop:4263 length:162 start_codon:yes stop_codon:yes gene_type:complete